MALKTVVLVDITHLACDDHFLCSEHWLKKLGMAGHKDPLGQYQAVLRIAQRTQAMHKDLKALVVSGKLVEMYS